MQLNRIDNAVNREGRNKLNENWKTLERTYKKAVDDSSEAVGIASQANNTSNYVQQQLDTVIIESGDANPEVAQARAGFVNLRERLDTEIGQVTTQLIETEQKKADISYVNQQIQASNLAWKESYSNLAGLQNAYPNGDDFNHVVLTDGMIYTWVNDAWTNTQVVAAGVNIPKNSVTPVKTVMFLPTENLLDPYQLENGYTDFTDGSFLAHSTYKVTPFIGVTGGLKYVTNKDARGYVFYDVSYTFISAVENTNSNQVVTAPTNSVYMRVTFSGSTNFGDAQLEQGDKVATYTKPHILDPSLIKNINAKNSVIDKTVTIDKLDFSIKSTKNFFNYLADIDNGVTYALPTDGTLSTASTYAFKVTKPIEIVAGQSYVSNGRIRSIAFYDANYIFVSGINTTLESGTAFIAPVNSKFMRINFYNSNVLKNVQIEKGLASTPFEPYQYIESFVQPKSITSEKLNDDVLALINNQTGKWNGKTFASFGTSIVWYDGKTFPDSSIVCRGYQTHLKEHLKFSTYDNFGRSGSSMAVRDAGQADSTVNVIKSQIFTGYDLVTIEAGSNDYKLDVPLGERGLVADSVFDNTTFYGAYREAIQYILTSNPQTRIVLFTPPKRNQSGYTEEQKNTHGLTMYDYVKAVIDIAELYGLPIVDQWHESGLNYYNASIYTIDGVHPNNLGFERLGRLAVWRIGGL